MTLGPSEISLIVFGVASVRADVIIMTLSRFAIHVLVKRVLRPRLIAAPPPAPAARVVVLRKSYMTIRWVAK